MFDDYENVSTQSAKLIEKVIVGIFLMVTHDG